MKLKKILQNIFKKTFQNLFKVIYGRIKILDNKSEFNFKKYNIEKINISGQVFTVNKNVYEIDNARVFTDLVEHVAIIKDNFILPKISYQQIKGELKDTSYNKVLFSGTNRMKKKIKGKVLSLLQGASGNNYFHFMFDIVPKILLLDEPFAALDIMTIKNLQQIIVDLQTQHNISIILCDHQARDLLTCVDLAIVLSNGRVVAKDTPNNLIKNIDAQNAYFGDSFKIN